ncbi:MAG TPA: selenoneine biosynthesis selenosugar synthase SenB [Candidatus Binatia bacterium]|nr:selenoneine biosynthesis selenosugar synthase SenB [Candidatus Binatia bacterium]
MTIRIVTPAGPEDRNGNSITALRWARILKRLGHRVVVAREYNGELCDLLIALHARKSAPSIRRFKKLHPDKALVLALTGTDLYRDIRTNAAARRSLELATRLVVLQSMGLKELPRRLRRKTRVIYQSASRVQGRTPQNNGFVVSVIGHLRPVKDPLRTAVAVRRLNHSRVRVVQAGRALDRGLERRARAEMARNPHYRWIGELPHWKTRRLLASSHLLSLTSVMEGSANVLSEAIASSVPVVASKISGLIGTLGENYPGYFRVGDTEGLARLLKRVESDKRFYRELKMRGARLKPLVHPKRERAAWKALVAELS